MARFGVVPAEPPACRTLDDCSPLFAGRVRSLLAKLEARGLDPIVDESIRSNERQTWLFNMGRLYDDGRGKVTNVPNAETGWHFFGLAVDIISKRYQWDYDSPGGKAFYDALREEATALDLTSGDDWNRNGTPVENDPSEHLCDRPHVQWWCEGMHVSPSENARALFASGGRQAVWRALHAA